ALPLGLGAREQPARAVAGAAERLSHGFVRPDEEKRVASHVARDQDRLAGRAKALRNGGMPRAERTRRALAVHQQLPPPSIHLVLLELHDVVADVVDEPEAEPGRPTAERALEGALGEAHHDLPVDPGVIG